MTIISNEYGIPTDHAATLNQCNALCGTKFKPRYGDCRQNQSSITVEASTHAARGIHFLSCSPNQFHQNMVHKGRKIMPSHVAVAMLKTVVSAASTVKIPLKILHARARKSHIHMRSRRL